MKLNNSKVNGMGNEALHLSDQCLKKSSATPKEKKEYNRTLH